MVKCFISFLEWAFQPMNQFGNQRFALQFSQDPLYLF